MSTTLHEQNGFKLTTGFLSSGGIGWNSWIYHWHADEKMWLSCGCLYSGECGRCAAKIPDEVYGLWKLHNWDEIGLMK